MLDQAAENTLVENHDNEDESLSNKSVKVRRDSDEITFGSQLPNANVSSSKVQDTEDPRSLTPVSNMKPRMTIDTPGPGVDTPTLERLRPKPLDLNNISVTPQRYADSQPSPSQAGKRKRDSSGPFDDMPTPKTPYGAHWTPNPSPNTRKYYKKVIDHMPNYELSEFEVQQMEKFRGQRHEDLPYFKHKEEEKISWQKALDKISDPQASANRHEEFLNGLEARGVPVIGRDKRSFEEIMEDKMQKLGKSWKNMGEEVSSRAMKLLEGEDEIENCQKSSVLDGVVILVAKKLNSNAQNLHRVVMELGGEVAWQFNSRVTHFVFQGRQNDITKEFRLAKEAGCFVVSPDWIYMCRDEKEKVSESTFPHTFNPRLKLDITETSVITSRSSRSNRSQIKTKSVPPQIEETCIEEMEGKELESTKAPPTDTMKVTEEVSADLAVMESLLDSVNKTPAPTSNRKVLRTVLTTQDNLKNTSTQQENTKPEETGKESQVMWIDPEEEVNRKKLADQLNAIETQNLDMETMDSMGSINIDNLTAMMENKENEKRKPRLFMVSGWTDNEPNVENAVNILGGKISLEGHYDPNATHMLAVKVSRSEKMLGSVAGGKWVLHPSYVTDSVNAGVWLAEEKYEWGNLENGYIKDDDDGMEFKLASAARKWRKNACESEGAFNGMKFILHMPENKKGPFSRYI